MSAISRGVMTVGAAHLLQRLYLTLTIPAEVAAELDQAGALHQGWRRQLGFIRIAESLADDPVMALLSAEVDRGEAAAIALARRLNSPLLIVD
jgi:predicted nucleic acid-binding protein